MSELYTLPDGWEWKKLGELAKFQSGGTPSRNNKTYWENGDIPWVKISDITDNMYVYKTKEFINKSGLNNSSAKLFSKGTILYTIFATIGKIGILDIEATTNQAISGIQPNQNVDLFYMYYGLKFITNEIQKISVGVAQNNINLTKLKEQWFPLPQLEEQKRIVAKLDILFAKIDKAITLHQKNIDEADIFMASVLNDVFVELEEKYKVVKISDIAHIKGGKRLPKGKKLSEKQTKYPYIRVADFLDVGTVNLETIQYITEDIYKQIKNYIITSNDLYISIAGTIGKTGIIPKELDGANLTENAAKLVYKIDDISNKYIYFLTKSSKFEEQIGLATKTVAQPKLALTRLSEVEIPLPPLKTQQKVVSYLDEISQKMEKIKQIQKEKMQSLKELKASILDKAFKGEL